MNSVMNNIFRNRDEQKYIIYVYITYKICYILVLDCNIKRMMKFNFVNGPPFCTGLPHYGHMLTMCIKDTVLRYKIMMGYDVEKRFGWDCHGVPIELIAEKELKGKRVSIKEYNDKCRELVMRYRDEWNMTIKKSGFIFDIDNDYKTMDLDYMNEVWKVFHQLYDRGMIYEGYKVLPYSYVLKTPLSNFEAKLNYRNVNDMSLIVMFRFDDTHIQHEDVNILVWTTTPWTLPSNMLLCVHPDYDYVIVQRDKKYLIAKDRVKSVFGDSDVDIIMTVKGRDLKDMKYTPLMSYGFTAPYNIVCDEYITLDKGTGIVHIAPGFGEDDFRIYQKYYRDMNIILPVDDRCRFTSEISDMEGKNVKDCDTEIVKSLRLENKVYSVCYEKHEYPFCWRSNTPLIFKACQSYFIKVEDVKDRLIEHNKDIMWYPKHIKDGRYGMWLSDIRDWCISRNRNWGNPIPIWKSQYGDIKVIRDIEELEDLSGMTITDLHRDNIDDITFKIDDKEYRRVNDVMDVWLESGCVPFGIHNTDVDWICEGVDQTRGWFYTLNVISSSILNRPASKAINVCGLILASDGEKMSKNKNNYPDVNVVLDRYGSDCLRLYLNGSQASKGNNLKFNEQDMKQINQSIMIYMRNVMEFFKQQYDYVNVNDIENVKLKIYDLETLQLDVDANKYSMMNIWILNEFFNMCYDLHSCMEHYDINPTTQIIIKFVDNLSRWYMNVCKNNFKLYDADSSDDRRRYDEYMIVLYNILYHFGYNISPYAPFMSDNMISMLKRYSDIPGDYKMYIPHKSKEDDMLLRFKEYVNSIREVKGKLKRSQKIPFKSVIFTNMNLNLELQEYLYDMLNAINISVSSEYSCDNDCIVRDVRDGKIIFDITYDDECKRVYEYKKFNRSIMNIRKRRGLKPKDIINVYYYCDEDIKELHNDEQERYLIPLLHQKVIKSDKLDTYEVIEFFNKSVHVDVVVM